MVCYVPHFIHVVANSILPVSRMSHFTFHRLRHTVVGISPPGIRKSQLLQDCEYFTRTTSFQCHSPWLLACSSHAPLPLSTLHPSFVVTMKCVTETTCISYILSLLLKRTFLLKCNASMLRLTTLLSLLTLPLALTRLICYHKRMRPPTSIMQPLSEATVLAAFPIAWFFGFLYYTDVPSLLFVVLTIVFATQERHWLAALVGFHLGKSIVYGVKDCS